jgi:hypothetical protein
MINKRKIIKYLLLVLGVSILCTIPWPSVLGIKDPDIIDSIVVFQRFMAFIILTPLLTAIVYQIFVKPLPQQVMEEEVKEAHQKNNGPSLFKPPIWVLIFFILLIYLSTWNLIDLFIKGGKVDINDILIAIVGISLSTWIWYFVPVFSFTEDSVQIKSYLFYVFGIDRKTIIKYADIVSVGPVPKGTDEIREPFRKYFIVISTEEKSNKYYLFFNNNAEKIYLRFQKKLGDKVKLE